MQKLAEFLSSEFQVSIPHNWNNKHLEKEQMLTSPKSTIDNYLVLGNKLERQGKLEEAISMYYSALNYDPNFYRYYLQLGKALEQQANSSVISNHQRYSLLDEVIGSYLVADILNPKIPWLKTKLGSLSNNLKALKESLTASPEFLLQITCRASSTQEEIYGPQNLFWGHLMIWHSQSPPEYPEWLEFELPQPQKWKGISIKPQEGNHERSPSTFTIMGSNDKQEWEPLLSISDYKWISDNWQQWNFEGQNEYKYYKMEIWANTGNLQWLTLERLAPIIDNYAVQPI
jgi:tetratricopeptide (TPR) repeat protein